MIISTYVFCPICKNNPKTAQYIVAEVDYKELKFDSHTPIGQMHRPEVEVKNFHCPNCKVLFLYPPGDPDAGEKAIIEFNKNNRGGKKV